jgi:hypothetical protein
VLPDGGAWRFGYTVGYTAVLPPPPEGEPSRSGPNRVKVCRPPSASDALYGRAGLALALLAG